MNTVTQAVAQHPFEVMYVFASEQSFIYQDAGDYCDVYFYIDVGGEVNSGEHTGISLRTHITYDQQDNKLYAVADMTCEVHGDSCLHPLLKSHASLVKETVQPLLLKLSQLLQNSGTQVTVNNDIEYAGEVGLPTTEN